MTTRFQLLSPSKPNDVMMTWWWRPQWRSGLGQITQPIYGDDHEVISRTSSIERHQDITGTSVFDVLVHIRWYFGFLPYLTNLGSAPIKTSWPCLLAYAFQDNCVTLQQLLCNYNSCSWVYSIGTWLYLTKIKRALIQNVPVIWSAMLSSARLH